MVADHYFRREPELLRENVRQPLNIAKIMCKERIVMRVPFVSFKPLEKELESQLRGAFERVFENSWYIEGKEDEAFEKFKNIA